MSNHSLSNKNRHEDDGYREDTPKNIGFHWPKIILETAVEREKAVQEIYVHREFLKLVVTLWVIRDFKSFLGA
jgi:hypothetical protein